MIGELRAQGKSLLISSHILSELSEMSDLVAIIEQGKMLATGTVDEILHGAIESRNESSVKLVSLQADCMTDPATTAAWLAAQPQVESPTVEGHTIEFRFPADPARQAELLSALVLAGHRVSRFAVKQRTLEEAFLHVTQGRVQ